MAGPSGPAPFSEVGPTTFPSALGVRYLVLQRRTRLDPMWFSALASAGGEVLAVFDEHAVLVRVEEGRDDDLRARLPDLRWAGEYLPAYKVAAPLAAVLAGDPPQDLVDHEGLLEIVAVFHRGEDPSRYESPMRAAFPGAVVARSFLPAQRRAEGVMGWVRFKVPPKAGAEAVSSIACFEAVSYVDAAREARPLLDESAWYLQTSLQPALAPPDGSVWRYDSTAKVFARGITGAGQVYGAMDTGVENDDCHFRYGPNVSDTTQFVDPAIQPPNAVPANPDPNYRPGNKIIAYYLLNEPGGPPLPYDDPAYFHHGTQTTGSAAGDNFFVLAAQAGLDLDDPADDEEEDAQAQVYGILVDHHQLADGMAPGAQVVFQDVQFPFTPPSGLINILEQAYDTGPGVRVHNDSWGGIGGSGSYSLDNRDADRQMWRLRDLLVVFAAGNQGPAFGSLGNTASFKSGLSIGATLRGNLGPGGGPAEDIAWFSSHGPGWPDRIKPELAAPGKGVQTDPDDGIVMPFPSSFTPERGGGDGDSGCNEVGPGANYASQGTSFAAPAVSGLALDVRQYFVQGFYPGGSPASSPGFAPTNALLKAVLVNSARNLPGQYTADEGSGFTSAPRPTHGQGWGHPVLDDTLFFAGDPTGAALGERSFLVVLDDTPNGLTDTGAVNDARGSILDSFQPAIRDGEVQSYGICADDTEDLHVTLAWTDVAGTPASGGGTPPLRNDLDLELVDPNGKIWRPNPGASTADPDRLWVGGYSVLGAAPCPADPACATICPPGELERDHPQGSAPFCDFRTRDSRNPLENVFISAADPNFIAGEWTLRVIGESVLGNGEPPTLARPNLVNGDGDPVYDTISDLDQGYSLVVSGAVASKHGIAYFDRPVYTCGDPAGARVFVRDCDGDLTSPLEVEVRTSAGDCDVFPLSGTPPLLGTSSFPVVDAGAGTAPSACPGDGTVVTGDDSLIRAVYNDTSPVARTAEATARVVCRNVRFDSAVVTDGCDPATSNGQLNRNEPALIAVTVENTRPVEITGLWGEIHPMDKDVLTPASGAVFGDVPAGPGTTATAAFPIYVAPAQECPSTLRFRLELSAAGGFRDRAWFDLPLTDCTNGTIGQGPRPGEVPAVDTPGVEQALHVSKTLAGNTNLDLTWDRATGAARYNIWRGRFHYLNEGSYNHQILLGEGAQLCNLPEQDPTDDPAVVNSQILGGDAFFLGPPAGNFYYLVTAEADCPTGASLDGSWGRADLDGDGTLDRERPAGLLLDPACIP